MVATRHRVLSLVLAALTSRCEELLPASSVVVHASARTRAVEDLARDLGQIHGATAEVVPGPARCRRGETHVVVEAPTAALPAQDYAIDERRCGDGRVVTLRGGSAMSVQWAAYDLLERLGVRYFHPERTLYPPRAQWPAAPLHVRETPAFRHRSMHAHTSHPIELSPPLEPGVDMAAYQRRWIDWNVALRQTAVDGWDRSVVAGYAHERGFPRMATLNLANRQQGRRPALDERDPRPEAEQIAAAIDAALAPEGGVAPTALEVQFNPSEFTVADEVATVRRLTAVATYVGARYPGVGLWTINHGTAQPPGPVFGMRFFDLPALAPPSLGVQVHPLMLYDLDRPAAGAYGNDDYHHLRDWLIEQAAVRRVIYYPESSWWLTFDLPVPLFLAPATLEARDHDLQRLRPLAARGDDATTGVWGHRLFTSGQEWGYWLVDYCTARLAWDPTPGWEGCLDHVVGALARSDVLGRVLRAATRCQRRDLRDPALVRLLVGSDDATEAGARTGVIVHPLPPRLDDVLAWDDAAVAAFQTASLAPLSAMAADYDRWADEVEATLSAQSPGQAPWVREIRDGLRIMALRARHAVAVYEAVLALRSGAVRVSGTRLDEARALTAAAARVVRAREADYRYAPSLQTVGDEPGTAGAIPNRTVYPYRVLSRTHRLYYWQRPDDQLAALLRAGPPVRLAVPGVTRWLRIPAGTLVVQQPPGLARLARLIPTIAVGLGRDRAGAFVAIAIGQTSPIRLAARGSASVPETLSVRLDSVGALALHGATVTLDPSNTIIIRGAFATDDALALLVSHSSLDDTGARQVLAAAVGVTPLPQQVELTLLGAGIPE